MRASISFINWKWIVHLLGIVALCVLVWLLGPLVAIAGAIPLESELARAMVVLLIVLIWLGWTLLNRARSGRKDKQLIADLSSSGQGRNTETQAAEENVAQLTRNFEEALRVLKETRARRRDSQYLYELPWYVIIGPPGSGKTTALVNSGLKFPLADRMGTSPVRGVSGTRNCEWLLTDEAILLDTAGRYATQDSHQAVDAAEWSGFLNLLKKYRPRRPINGALVTLSIADLMQHTDQERALHAKAIRSRIQELYTVLGVRFPIYMLFTKCDLVAGFTDFFADMNQEARAQVWGETFAADNPQGCLIFLERFGENYEALLRRLHQQSAKRIQDERDITRRVLILNFPEQMVLLKPAIAAFLDEAFGANRYEAEPLLRGVYFTSGTQEGTPIDRVMGILAAAFGLDRQSLPIFSGRGKSYFITRLLRDVIFQEAELAGVDRRLEQRRRLIQVGAYVGTGALVVVVIALWIVSYSKNQYVIGRVAEYTDSYRKLEPIDNTSWQAQLSSIASRLNLLLDAKNAYDSSGGFAHIGLYQGGKVSLAATHAYDEELQNQLLPLILQRTAQRMTGPEGSKPDILYELLRVYLMFGQPERLDSRIAASWIRTDWEQHFHTQPELLAQLSLHLENLLQLSLQPLSLDHALIAATRAKLTQVPLVMQIYTRFRDEASIDHAHDFSVAAAAGAEGDQVFAAADGRDISTMTIPALFTAYGYSEIFLKTSLAFIKDAIVQNWVLGQQNSADIAEIQRLHEDFQQLYLDDYQRAWADLLANLKLRRVQGINQTVQLLELLSRPNTPLIPLLEAVEKNTSLSRISSEAAELMTKVAGGGGVKPDERTQRLMETAKEFGHRARRHADPVRNVEASFEHLNTLVRKVGDRPPPIDSTLQLLGQLHDYIMRIGSFAGSGEQALKSAAGRMAGGGSDVILEAKAAFARLPEPLKSWFMPLTTVGWSQTLSGAKGELNVMFKSGVAPQCKTAFNGRYPFSGGSPRDTSLMDFGKFFAPNGVFDQFFQTNLKSFVDTEGPVWKQLSVDNQSVGLSQATIRQFQNAARIKEAFFPSGGQVPSVAFELRAVSLDDKANSFRLALEGQETTYQRGAEPTAVLRWPGVSPGSGARVVFETSDGRQVSKAKEGPWAFFRLLDEASLEKTGEPDRFKLTFQVEGYRVSYELRAGSQHNPFALPELRGFSCPEML